MDLADFSLRLLTLQLKLLATLQGKLQRTLQRTLQPKLQPELQPINRRWGGMRSDNRLRRRIVTRDDIKGLSHRYPVLLCCFQSFRFWHYSIREHTS